ncbi:MAG: thioether cross-link-forming SCIFF peptide maturase [Defluviitaleaceae bacterium]|nr:thioether cross-link-forming SCIFF peptide maturase [Defluviitaleaceae bacterium]
MIHAFAINGRRLAYDSVNGSLAAPDETAYEILKLYEETGFLNRDGLIERLNGKFSAENIIEAYSEVEMFLAKSGASAQPDLEQTKKAVNERKPAVKALCLHAAHACNMRCAYCFAGQGTFSGSEAYMSTETGRRAVDFLIENSAGKKNLEIDFFGGEPTLNFKVIKEVVTYAKSLERERGKNFRFTLTTNGLLVDEEIILFADEFIDNIVLSLDGRKEVNDRMRGAGTYDAALPGIKKAAESRGNKKYYIRGTYTRHNLDFCADVLHLADLGFKNISVEPVVAPLTEPYSIRVCDLPAICIEYEKLADKIIKNKDINFFHFNVDLDGGPCVIKRSTGCGAGTEYFSVVPNGGLYPCHQFADDKKFRMGDVSAGINAHEIRSGFLRCNVFNKPACEKCWAKRFCGGGCAANAYHMHGDILQPDEIGCELQKKRVECALYIKSYS